MVIGNLAFRFKVKRTPDGGGDHLGVVDGRVGPAFELALGQKMDLKPRRQQPQAPLTRVFSALAFRLAAISDTALLGAAFLRSAGVTPT